MQFSFFCGSRRCELSHLTLHGTTPRPSNTSFSAFEEIFSCCTLATIDPASQSGSDGILAFVTKCPVGTYSPSAGSVKCQLCPPGTYRNTPGALACTKCYFGFFQPNSGQSKCLRPRSNYYVEKMGAKKEMPCPIGTTTGSRAFRSTCDYCKPGQEGLGWARGCTYCRPGTYNPTAGRACKKCPKGYYSSSNAATSCTPAPYGSYVNFEGATRYAACPRGYYSDSRAQASCKPCPAGRVSPSTGSQQCTLCQSGFYAPHPASTTCRRCPSGSISNKSGTACIQCPRHLTIAYSLDKRSCHKFGECYFPGEDFVSTTEHHANPSYYKCQAWDLKTCPRNTEGRSCHVPSSVVKEALVTGNTCRSFRKDKSTNYPWCYTTGSRKWQACTQIPKCGERVKECYKPGTQDYVSGISVTKSGKPCQSWEIRTCPPGTSGKTCHVPNDPVKRANKIGSTCRIIPGDSGRKPWCYTTTSLKWEYCDIPQC